MINRQSFITVAIVLLVAVVSGSIIATGILGVQEHQKEMHNRAESTYGEYTNTTSWTTPGTATSVPVPANLSEYATIELVEKHLYVTGYSYELRPLADTINQPEHEVESALVELQTQETVDKGYVTHSGFIPYTEYIHMEHGELPDQWWSPYSSVLPVGFVVMASAIVIAYIRRIRGCVRNE